MGRYEDLLQEVRDGSTEAIDSLESEFGGSSLRKQAEAGVKAQTLLEEQTPLAREGAFNRLVNDLDEELREVPLSVEDFMDVSPQDLTIDVVSSKARSKLDTAEASLREQAEAQGYDSVEEFQKALEAVKKETTKKVDDMNAIGGGTTSGGSDPVPDEVEEPFDAMDTAYKASRKEGKSQDKAMGVGIEALLTAQAPVDVDEGE